MVITNNDFKNTFLDLCLYSFVKVLSSESECTLLLLSFFFFAVPFVILFFVFLIVGNCINNSYV